MVITVALNRFKWHNNSRIQGGIMRVIAAFELIFRKVKVIFYKSYLLSRILKKTIDFTFKSFVSWQNGLVFGVLNVSYKSQSNEEVFTWFNSTTPA